MMSTADGGRPNAAAFDMVRVQDVLAANLSSNGFHTVASTNTTELWLDGVSQGKKSSVKGETVNWAPAACACNFTVTANVQCHGLQQVKGAHSVDACKQACCQSCGCTVYQYSSSDACWIGAYLPSACHAGDKATWQGQARPGSTSSAANVTAVAYNDEGEAVAKHQIIKPGAAVALKLYVDAPSPTTATGDKLVLDGEDTAAISVALVDARGNLVAGEVANVTFSVTGVGRLIGTGNGDHQALHFPKAATVPTYIGWARAFVQVAEDCVSLQRDLISQIDVDNNKRTHVISPTGTCDTSDIVVSVSAAGLEGAKISVPVSNSLLDSPLAVAQGTTPLSGYTYMDDFQG